MTYRRCVFLNFFDLFRRMSSTFWHCKLPTVGSSLSQDFEQTWAFCEPTLELAVTEMLSTTTGDPRDQKRTNLFFRLRQIVANLHNFHIEGVQPDHDFLVIYFRHRHLQYTHFSIVTMTDFLRSHDILSNDIACSKAARLCNSCKTKWSWLTTVNAGEIRKVPFVKNNDMEDLIAELPRYIAAVDRSDVDVDTVELWTRHLRDLIT